MINSITSLKGALDLSGKTALVTGGGRGLGAAIALALAESGADVAVCSRTDAKETLATLAQFGGKYKGYLADVASADDIKRLAEEVYDDYGRIDILVNNAGISAVGDFLDDEGMENWSRVLATNLQGTAMMTHAIGNRMRTAEGDSCIINISSIGGDFVLRTQNMACYCASKAAINSFTKSMAYELAKYDIRVNAIAPGFTHSELSKMIPPGQIEYLEKTIVTGRFNEAIEVGAMAVFLASPAAAAVTGVIIPMNGGQDLSV